MIAVSVQTAVPVLAAVAATLRQPDQAENQATVQQNTNQAVQKAERRWILKHS